MFPSESIASCACFALKLTHKSTLGETYICPIGETGVKGEAIPVESEQDIFDILDLEYREPEDRDL